MHLLQPRAWFDGEPNATANFRAPVMWLRSRSQPLKLSEIVQAIVVLAFAFVIPILLIPTIAVLLIAFLDRLGLTLLGKVVVLVLIGGALAASEPILRLLLLAYVRLTNG
jgi:hypothetical protein